VPEAHKIAPDDQWGQFPKGLLFPCSYPDLLFHSAELQSEDRIMAKGQMRSNKEARKPKKDAKKPAPAPALKAAPVTAIKLKDKK